jgi:hypothetical protein
MKYTEKQLTDIWNEVKRIDDIQKKSTEVFKLWFEEQYPPFMNFANPTLLISYIDPWLFEDLDYVLYEVDSMMRSAPNWMGYWVTDKDWNHCTLNSGDCDNFIRLCKFMGRVEDSLANAF